MKRLYKLLSFVLVTLITCSFFGCSCNQKAQDIYVLNAIVFESQTLTYDGQEHSLTISTLPVGVTVVYEGNNKVDANVYQVKAILTLNGTVVEKFATLTINKATLTVKAKDVVEYVGSEIKPEYEITGFVNGETIDVLTTLPSFVNDKTDAGTYTDYIVFSGGTATNYEFVYESADLKLVPIYSDYIVDGVTYIEFGEYPQTVVSDVTLKGALIQAYDVNELDERGYFHYNGEKYVKIRANVMTGVGIVEDKLLFDCGEPIVNEETYFFKVEPIKWRVLAEKNGELVLMADKLLDTKSYNASSLTVKGDNQEEIYASNWEHSDIREWLNEEFLNKAFASVHKNYLFEGFTNNSSVTALYDRYANGKDTMDKVFLPSYSQIKNLDKSVLLAETTDYARATGAYMLYGKNGFGGQGHQDKREVLPIYIQVHLHVLQNMQTSLSWRLMG